MLFIIPNFPNSNIYYSLKFLFNPVIHYSLGSLPNDKDGATKTPQIHILDNEKQ